MADYDELSENRKRRSPSPVSSASVKSSKRAKTKASPAGEKSNRGLRHFSIIVYNKVKEKGTTTYNEVADELVQKVLSERADEMKGKDDEKNIRRRVYDALNVLSALNIISKEKKDITWIGLPTAKKQDLQQMKDEIAMRERQLQEKKQVLKELLVQKVSFHNLVNRNIQSAMPRDHIPLPFVVVNTHSSSVVQCDMSGDKTDVMLEFSMPFEINDDNTILKKMGMDKTTYPEFQTMLPPDIVEYCRENQMLDHVMHPHHMPPMQHMHRRMEQQPSYHPAHHRAPQYYDHMGP
ncbi:MAG: hypothetical protein SGBAC_002500 [Bacillariaceae sp.]